MKPIRTYNEHLQGNRSEACGIASGTILLAVLAGGVSIQALRSGDILGGFEAGATALGFGAVAIHAAMQGDSKLQA